MRKNYKDDYARVKSIAETSATGGESYLTKNAFKPKYKYRLKKVNESSLSTFQQNRLKTFDKIEDTLNSLSPLIANAKQETTLGFQLNPVNISAKIKPEEVTETGIEALRYAQEKELPNEIRDAIIAKDDRKVANFLVRNDDGFRIKYADRQDLAQAEAAFGKQISPKERMQFWEMRTNAYAKADKELYKNV
jgi:hypothetical protein